MPAKLYLIPNFISAESSVEVIPAYVGQAIAHVRHFFVEERKSAEKLLKRLKVPVTFADCEIFLLNEQTSRKETEEFFSSIVGKDIGVISESGCPCIADPGADLVLLAHQNGMEVVPLVGPSSIILGLMASGLNGQSFVFHGYLPREQELRIRKIKEWERRSVIEKQTQIFMDTPYRNLAVFRDIVSSCDRKTWLCVASEISSPSAYIKTLSIKDWQNVDPPIHKKPALFLIRKDEKTSP